MTPETFQSQQQILPQYQFEEDTISLLDILLVLAQHIKLIIVTPVIFCIMTIIYVFFIANPIYVSKATFMSSGSGGSNSQMMGLASQFGIAMPMEDSSPKWSYEEVIKSRTMAKSLLVHIVLIQKSLVLKKNFCELLHMGMKNQNLELILC